jgi:hypothetical protein
VIPAGFVFAFLTWSRVTTDRCGRPEPGVTYLVPWAYSEGGGIWISGETGTAHAYIGIPDPPVGAVLLWRDPVAVDAAGNRSDDDAPAGCDLTAGP